jgi:hypothetical protein
MGTAGILPAALFAWVVPPAQYDHPYHGQVIIQLVRSEEELEQLCHNNVRPSIACALEPWRPDTCLIYMVTHDIREKYGWSVAIILRHEIGHCNGWPGDHRNSRRAIDMPGDLGGHSHPPGLIWPSTDGGKDK